IYLLSTLLFWYLLRSYDDDRPRSYVVVLLLLILGTATHPTFLFPAVGFALGVSLVKDDARLGWNWPTRNGWMYLWGPFVAVLISVVALFAAAGSEDSVRNWGSRGALAAARLIAAVTD